MKPSPYAARERARWITENASRFIRPDAARFYKPGTKLEDVFPALALKYSPNQPRVPAGHGRESGRWTDGEGESGIGQFDAPSKDERQLNDEERRYDTRLASDEDRPRLGQRSKIAIAAEIGWRIIQRFRSENLLFDLFNQNGGAVAHVKIDDRDVFGSNSGSPLYTAQDREAANDMRDKLIAKYPEILSSDNIGQAPNNALYHAETNILLRSAAENGGTLAGRSLEIYVDREFCKNCQTVVPLVGLEIGNPTLTVVDPTRIFSIRDGRVVARIKR